jgi:hypothetical protein
LISFRPLLFLLALSPLPVLAETVACHYSYGGETRVLLASPVASPYAVPAIPVGSYFQFRVVFQKEPADQASIKVYTYADQEDGAVIIHQATYPYPPPASGRYGFTGYQAVYEQLRGSELQYWCELRSAP